LYLEEQEEYKIIINDGKINDCLLDLIHYYNYDGVDDSIIDAKCIRKPYRDSGIEINENHLNNLKHISNYSSISDINITQLSTLKPVDSVVNDSWSISTLKPVDSVVNDSWRSIELKDELLHRKIKPIEMKLEEYQEYDEKCKLLDQDDGECFLAIESACIQVFLSSIFGY
jgi:hypothetical protein